jgi:hypothetical protein
MPKVGKKEFPYTKAGMKAAATAAEKMAAVKKAMAKKDAQKKMAAVKKKMK